MLSGGEGSGGEWGNCGEISWFTTDEKSKADGTSLCKPFTGSPLTGLVGECCWLLGEGGLDGDGTELGGVGGNVSSPVVLVELQSFS